MRDARILTTLWFISGLSILLLNDFIFKEAYGNWLTGKLSDFAGLFIFPLFWTVIFPRFKKTIFVLTGVLFLLWKSSMSQGGIDLWNNLGVFPISRVQDYTDLMALSILPLAYFLEKQKEKLLVVRLHPVLPLLLALFSFVATSRQVPTIFPEGSAVYHVKHHSRDSLIRDLELSNLEVSLSDTYYSDLRDASAYFTNLADSVLGLDVFINDFNSIDSTVEISLRDWEWAWHLVPDRDFDEATMDRQRNYVRKAFEEKVLPVIQKD